jgi:hypothetical protein
VVYRCPKAPAGEQGGTSPGSKREHECHLSRYGWAKLIARVYETDPLQRGRCGGRMEIIAFVVQVSEVRQILAHVGLPVEASKVHTARGPPQSDLLDARLLANGQ